jgi:pilus assembly protein CpaF
MANDSKKANGDGRAATASPRGELKATVHARLLQGLDLVQARKLPRAQLREECMHRVDRLVGEQQTPLTGEEKQQLVLEVMDEIFGLGPIEILMRDPTISDILVNGPKDIYIERMGQLERTDVQFRDNGHVLQVIQRIASRMGRRIDEGSPMLDARLECGSRVNAIIPPLALQGPVMSIRRFAVRDLEASTLVELKSISEHMCTFLEAAVRCKMNIVISGGTGTGKTTLLNVLSKWIPNGERVITLEDAAELRLQGDHIVSLETRPANTEGQGEVTQRDLLRNTLRMRPDRIIIGEVRGAEALDMMQAMNTGHEGSMTTVHANTTRDALRRLENMISMAGLNFPVHAIRDQMSSTLDLIIQIARVTGGRRKVVSITEVTGMEGEVILLQDIFRFRQEGIDKEGHAFGSFESCGVRPRMLERMTAEGISLPSHMFRRPQVV